jgi:hypothetical protein
MTNGIESPEMALFDMTVSNTGVGDLVCQLSGTIPNQPRVKDPFPLAQGEIKEFKDLPRFTDWLCQDGQDKEILENKVRVDCKVVGSDETVFDTSTATCEVVCPCCNCGCKEAEGCTLGFWKNNAGLDYNYKNGKPSKIQDNCWCGDYYADKPLSEVFNNTPVPTDTMIDALNYGGEEGHEYNLLRQAIPAVLNACSVKYPYTDDKIKSMVNGALAVPNHPENGITAMHDKLATANESETEDECIEGKCVKSGEECNDIDMPCEPYHNCPIDSHCNHKMTEPMMTPHTPFDAFMASENPPAACGN